eukprot:731908-Prymnesium_polylepis.1
MVICPSLLGAFLSSLRAQCVPMPAVCSLRATLWLREVHDPSPFRLPSLDCMPRDRPPNQRHIERSGRHLTWQGGCGEDGR